MTQIRLSLHLWGNLVVSRVEGVGDITNSTNKLILTQTMHERIFIYTKMPTTILKCTKRKEFAFFAFL